MAKVTLENGMVFEGTNDELVELFTKLGAKIPAVEATTITAPAIYRKVTDREARVGDYVTTDRKAGMEIDVTAGKYYEIKDDGELYFLDDVDDERYLSGYDVDIDYVVYEKVASFDDKGFLTDLYVDSIAEPAPALLMKGDYARVLATDGRDEEITIGEIRLIVEDDKSDCPFYAETLDGTNSNWFEAHELTLATDEEVAAAKAELERKELERKWASINRIPNEFKKGDIVRGVRRLGDGRVVEGIVEDVDKEVAAYLGIKPFNEVGGYYAINATELITPVEARFDLSSKGDR